MWLEGSNTDSNSRLSFSTAPSPLIQATEPSPPFSPGKGVLATEQKSMLTMERMGNESLPGAVVAKGYG